MEREDWPPSTGGHDRQTLESGRASRKKQSSCDEKEDLFRVK